MAKLAAEGAAAGMPTKPLTGIQQWIDKFQRGSVNDVTFVGKRQHFYQTLMEIGGNAELPYIMPTALLHVLRLQSFPWLDNEKRQQVIDEYARIIDAVLDGDAGRASRVGKQHVQAAKKRLSALPDEVFPDSRMSE